MTETMCEMIISNFFGAFLGFVSAIIVEILIGKKDDKEMQEKVDKSISLELEDIRIGLEKIENKKSNPEYFRYQYIVWEMCINSGFLFSISGEKIYTSYMNVYTMIQAADDIEKRYFELLCEYEKKDNKKLSELLKTIDIEREKRRKEILDELKKLKK